LLSEQKVLEHMQFCFDRFNLHEFGQQSVWSGKNLAPSNFSMVRL